MTFYRDKGKPVIGASIYATENNDIIVSVYYDVENDTITTETKNRYSGVSVDFMKNYLEKISEKELGLDVKQAFVRGIFGEKV